MIVSRTMRLGDYVELTPEMDVVEKVIRIVGLDPAQHRHRRWEYALALHAVNQRFGTLTTDKGVLQVGDFGCAIGLLAPIMVWLGHDVHMYEPWAWGNQEEQCLGQCSIAQNGSSSPGKFTICHRDLSHLEAEDKGRFDVSFCISTMEHVPNETEAMNDLFDSVAPGGITFLTMDFGPDETDHYMSASVRARIYCPQKMQHLVELGQAQGFELLGGESDWSWHPEMTLVNNHGFSAIGMVRR